MEKIIEYLNQHQSHYVGKYKLHSCVQTSRYEYKFHYYIRDAQFRELSVFLTIDYSHHIAYKFSIDLHSQEEEYIVKDALNKILYFLEHKTILDCSDLELFVHAKPDPNTIMLEPLDYRNILNYLQYHRGITQETVDHFYSIFIPFLTHLRKQQQYQKYMDAINLLLDKILVEYEWDGVASKYLDTQYQFHLYYFRIILKEVYQDIEMFYQSAKSGLLEGILRLCHSQRFSFAIMSDLGNLVLSDVQVSQAMLKYAKEQDEDLSDNLVLLYLQSIFENDTKKYREVSMNVIRSVIKDILTFANHDFPLAIGHSIVAREGYEILIELFEQDYNTFVFRGFPIDTFPDQYKNLIREKLETAIRYYAKKMEREEYRISSFEQIVNINRLLMENYKEYGKNEQN